MKSWLLRLASATLFALCAHAQAIQVSVTPLTQNITLGSPTSADLVISGLGVGTAPSLGTFDIDVGFDPAILSFSSATFGDPILGDQLDLFGLGSVSAITPGSGTVNLFQLSLDLPSDIDSLQSGNFTLATLWFNTLQTGASPLTIGVNALGDSLGDPLTAEVVSGTLNVEAIPEPENVVLFTAGLLMVLAAIRRRARCT